jgi:hypothetical protein
MPHTARTQHRQCMGPVCMRVATRLHPSPPGAGVPPLDSSHDHNAMPTSLPAFKTCMTHLLWWGQQHSAQRRDDFTHLGGQLVAEPAAGLPRYAQELDAPQVCQRQQHPAAGCCGELVQQRYTIACQLQQES